MTGAEGEDPDQTLVFKLRKKFRLLSGSTRGDLSEDGNAEDLGFVTPAHSSIARSNSVLEDNTHAEMPHQGLPEEEASDTSSVVSSGKKSEDARLRKMTLDDLLGEFNEADPLLNLEINDKYDEMFDKMRLESLKLRQSKVANDLLFARRKAEFFQSMASDTADEITNSRSKIGRAMVDRLRCYQNPPALIGVVMEMIFILMGKLLPNGRIRGFTSISRRRPSTEGGIGAGSSIGRGSARGSIISNISGGPAVSARSVEQAASIVGESRKFTLSIHSEDSGDSKQAPHSHSSSAGIAKEKKIDIALWKHMRLSMMDPINFLEMLYNIPWEEGLDEDIVRTLKQSTEDQVPKTKSGTFAENDLPLSYQAVKEDLKNIADEIVGGPAKSDGLTVLGARFVSEEAALLVSYALAIIKYSRLRGPLKIAQEKLFELERENSALVVEQERHEMEQRKETEVITDKSTNALPSITPRPYLAMDEKSLGEMIKNQEVRFNEAIKAKTNFLNKVKESEKLLKIGKKVLQELSIFEQKWKLELEEVHLRDPALLANSMLVAGYLVYGGYLSLPQRQVLMDNFVNLICLRHLGPIGLAPCLWTHDLRKESTNLTDITESFSNEIHFDLNAFRMVSPISKALRADFTSVCPKIEHFLYEEHSVEVSQLRAINAKSNESRYREQTNGKLILPVVEQLALLSLANLECATVSGWRVISSQVQTEMLPFFFNPEIENLAIGAWNLICDPTRRVVSWLFGLLMNLQFMGIRKNRVEVVVYSDLTIQLEQCLIDGSTLFITDCDIHTLTRDQKLVKVLMSYHKFFASDCPDFVKINMHSDNETLHEIECKSSFRLYLHTTEVPQNIPPIVATYTRIVFFPVTRDCLAEEFTDRFVALQKHRIHNELTSVINIRMSYEAKLKEIDKKVLSLLSIQDQRILDKVSSINQIFSILEDRAEILESHIQNEVNEESITRARNGFLEIGKRAAVCCEVAQRMRHLNDLYTWPYDFFLVQFDHAILQSDRSSLDSILESIRHCMFGFVARGLSPIDQLLLSTQLALETCDLQNQLSIGEREFLVSPQLGCSTIMAQYRELNSQLKLLSRLSDDMDSPLMLDLLSMTTGQVLVSGPGLLENLCHALAPCSRQLVRSFNSKGQAFGTLKPLPEQRYLNLNLKKPFEWMLTEQFNNLQMLAAHFDWFAHVFDRMYKDGKENQWRLYMENEVPESCPLPDKLNEQLNPLQRLLLLRSVRPDRILPALRNFVEEMLGTEFIADCASDADEEQAKFIRLVNPVNPVLLVYDKSPENALNTFKQLVKFKDAEVENVYLEGSDRESLEQVTCVLRDAAMKGKWILIQTLVDDPSQALSRSSTEIEPDARLLYKLITEIRKVIIRLTCSAGLSPRYRCFIVTHCALVESGPKFIGSAFPKSFENTKNLCSFHHICPKIICANQVGVIPHMLRCLGDPETKQLVQRCLSRAPSPSFRGIQKSQSSLVSSSNSNDWITPLAYHNLALLQGALQLRSRFPVTGWSACGLFANSGVPLIAAAESLFKEMLKVITTEARKPLCWLPSTNPSPPTTSRYSELPEIHFGQRYHSWQNMRYLLSHVSILTQ
ncbi:hypothetical protein Ciccas_000409 [Cichlidogyrus casuarinus]|uniref:Dynein heavy chain ATP-binding dynein motor region domain-containing protein n=1 Tax=Cichlidogyrus casuarinus TaxID=1844966 RepID=A0ABD2QN09_9PLAT